MSILDNFFQTMFNDNSNPCLITQVDNQRVVFANLSMQKLLKESGTILDYSLNPKCYQILYDKPSPCEHCHLDKLKSVDFIENYVYNAKFDKNYRATNTLLELEGVRYNFCKYFLTSAYINKQISFDDALNQTIEIFAKTDNDMDEMSQEFLELIGHFYQSEKSFVFYISEDKQRFLNKYRWTRHKDITVQVEATEKIPLDRLLQWISTKDANNIVEVNNLIESTMVTPLQQGILKAFNINNITLCVIENEKNEPIAGVGISNRASIEFDYRLLRSTTHFIKDRFSKCGMQDEIKHIADTDFLTGFYSRIKYVEVLNELKDNPPQKLGIIFININGLRRTNEYLGFEHGDALISDSSTLIRNSLTERFFRISGDEFVGFFVDEDEDLFFAKVDKIHDNLKEYGKPLFSLGQAYKTGNNINVLSLINEADVVMYINKQEFYHFNDSKSSDVSDNTLKDLLRYIDNDEFLVYLQPQVELKTSKVVAAEALIRRFDKTNRKMVFPDQFIPLYEQKSIIRHVDIFVVDKVCQTLAEWIKIGKEIDIAVNLSRVTLMEYDIVNTISDICDQYEVPHHLLIIEVTERVGLIENEVTNTLIDQFKENGFKLSLDDFGCAYSNIVTLANISIDEVKIDKSLIDNLIENRKNRVIVKSVIDMCDNIGSMHTLAEGIEHQEQADLLLELNCKYGQGYLYSRPIPIDEFCMKYIAN